MTDLVIQPSSPDWEDHQPGDYEVRHPDGCVYFYDAAGHCMGGIRIPDPTTDCTCDLTVVNRNGGGR